MPVPVLFRHPSSLLHETGVHPEQPARIVAIEEALAGRDWLGHDVRESPEATDAQVAAVHAAGYVRGVKETCAAGGGALDPDTVVSRGSWEAALHSAGGAVALVDALAGGEATFGSSLHRPPGHHAEPAQAMGFCLLANVAIAARHAMAAHGLERIVVLDWDVHHGNGTHDVFYDDPRVLFCSIHQWPMWPGSGALSQTGTGAGTGYTVNLPVPAGSSDDLWCSLVEHVVAPIACAFDPQLILVSAGYDAHADDPLAGCEVTDAGFATMAASVRRLLFATGAPVGVVLEGGYDLGALARGVVSTLEVLSGPAPEAAALPVHPYATQALARLGGGRLGPA